jgi:hypothetical protein
MVRAIQRVYFHPLSKYPGPKLRIATRIPGHIEIWTGVRHLKIGELHRRYGHVVRVNHDELSFTDPNAWKDVCQSRQLCLPVETALCALRIFGSNDFR